MCGRGPRRGSLLDWLGFTKCRGRTHPPEVQPAAPEQPPAQEEEPRPAQQGQEQDQAEEEAQEQELLRQARLRFGPEATLHPTHLTYAAQVRCGGVRSAEDTQRDSSAA